MTEPPAVPVLLVTGFLGAGKTTLVNHVLTQAAGRRIAAVVNDFGAVNIDAELIVGASDGIISLANGCICCSLEGDLLRTLAGLLRRDPRPEAIVIETSGVADPGDIVRNLMDPVVWRQTPLETVICMIDAADADKLDDSLRRMQVRAADIVVLGKTDLAGTQARDATHAAVRAVNPRGLVVEAEHGRVALDLLFPPDADPTPAPRDPGRRGPKAERYETFTWISDRPIPLSRLQSTIERLTPRLARAKGLFETVEHPGRQMLLQLAGGRATLAFTGRPTPPGLPPVRIVFIAEIGATSRAETDRLMDG